MNETVLKNPLGLGTGSATATKNRRRKRSSGFYGYTALAILTAGGWLLRDEQFIDPQVGLGYWLGIIGGLVMLFLLMYPLRKRYRLLHIFGSARQWFRLHIILGLLGPLMILYHCNFHLGSFNSRVALYCMLLVAGSGIVGKHFYAKIHKGLYGRKANLQELQKDLSASREKSHGFAAIMPKLAARLDDLAVELQGDRITQTLGIRRSLRWAVKRHVVRLSLLFIARRELRVAALHSEVVMRNQRRLRKSASRYIKAYTNLLGRIAQFSFYERLFALWHVFHLPLFFMMVISAIVHVLAVHMY
jgi:hypothetical protein